VVADYYVYMSPVLVVTIDGGTYRVEGERSADDALADFRRLMRQGALDELPLAGGQRMVVHWGRVAAVSVSEGEARDEELSHIARPTESRWPQRPF
jgi:hypothetical protein